MAAGHAGAAAKSALDKIGGTWGLVAIVLGLVGVLYIVLTVGGDPSTPGSRGLDLGTTLSTSAIVGLGVRFLSWFFPLELVVALIWGSLGVVVHKIPRWKNHAYHLWWAAGIGVGWAIAMAIVVPHLQTWVTTLSTSPPGH